MRLIILALILSAYAVTGCGPDQSSSKSPASAEDLKWAREIADGYLRAASKSGFYNGAVSAWMSSAFKELVEKSYLQDYMFTEWLIQDEKTSPHGDEVLFRGQLKATWDGGSKAGSFSWIDPPKEVAFTLRIVKGQQNGKWQVDSVQFEDPKPNNTK